VTPEWVSAVAAVIQSFGTVAALAFGIMQIRQINEQLMQSVAAQRAAGWASMLSLESAISSARNTFTRLLLEEQQESDVERRAALTAAREAAEEDYRNHIDRLCSGLLLGHLDHRSYKQDYYQTVMDIGAELRSDTAHRNIFVLSRRWQQEAQGRSMITV